MAQTPLSKQHNQQPSRTQSFARLLQKVSVVGLLTAILLQGCIQVQQPAPKISISQPETTTSVTLSHQSEAGLQVIGSFMIQTEAEGAFLETIQFQVNSPDGALRKLRIKMKGDDQWLSPAEINIYLDAQQQHQFDIAAIITPIELTAESSRRHTLDVALSDFQFLKSNAKASINRAKLTYSILI